MPYLATFSTSPYLIIIIIEGFIERKIDTDLLMHLIPRRDGSCGPPCFKNGLTSIISSENFSFLIEKTIFNNFHLKNAEICRSI